MTRKCHTRFFDRIIFRNPSFGTIMENPSFGTEVLLAFPDPMSLNNIKAQRLPEQQDAQL